MPAAKPRLGATLRKERKRRLMTVRDMAEAIRAAAPDERERESLPRIADLMRMYRNWERDTYGVSERYQMLLCRVFETSPDDLLVAAYSEWSSALAGSPVGVETGKHDAFRLPEGDDVERRRMLQALAALGGASAPPFSEALRRLHADVDASLGRGVAAQLDDWEATLDEFGYTYLAVPPQQMVGELAADLASVRSIGPQVKEGHPEYTRWCRVTGGLSLLMAKTLCNLGQSREARPWWSTAQHAADTSGDTDLSLRVAGERLTRALYAPRPAPTLLRQTDALLARAPGPCAGLGHVRAARAQLFATEGRTHQAEQEIREVNEVLLRLPAVITQRGDSTLAWREDRLRYTEAWTHAYSGAREQLDVATEQALHFYGPGDPRSAMQIKLLQAFGHVRAGDVTEGTKHAAAVYGTCPDEQRTTLITRLAGLVWDAVPADRRNAPSAVAYRELLAGPSGRKPIT